MSVCLMPAGQRPLFLIIGIGLLQVELYCCCAEGCVSLEPSHTLSTVKEQYFKQEVRLSAPFTCLNGRLVVTRAAYTAVVLTRGCLSVATATMALLTCRTPYTCACTNAHAHTHTHMYTHTHTHRLCGSESTYNIHTKTQYSKPLSAKLI